jgi:hypothetical protein
MSSSYKLAALKSQVPSNNTEKFRVQAQQLQELFPAWSSDGNLRFLYCHARLLQLFLDLHSLLTEVGGDVELAATRITEG